MAEFIIIVEGPKREPERRKSWETVWDMLGLRIGASKLVVTETAGAIDVSAQQLKVANPTGDNNPATKKQLDDEIAARGLAETALSTAISDEVTARGQAVSDEASTRSTADGNLSTAIGTVSDGLAQELLDRAAGDSANAGDIADEALARSTQDGILQGEIDALGTTVSGHTTTINSLSTTVSGHTTDIATLQGQVAAILANNPDYETFIATEGQTDFTASSLSWNDSNTVFDIIVLVDGRWNLVGENLTKTSTTQFTLSEPVAAGKKVTVWKQGTSVASSGGGGGATDLENIVVNISPAVSGAKSLGVMAKAWKSVILRDTDTIDVWELKISSGVIQAVKLN